MKILSLLLIATMILVAPSVVSAGGPVSLSVSATVSDGTDLGTHEVLECTGYSYVKTGDPFVQCTRKGAAAVLNFGTLSTRLQKTDGSDDGGAGCFYASKFFIVYLYPDAWGGSGYELKQTAASFPSAIANSVVMTPVYSASDKYDPAKPETQGALNVAPYSGEVLGVAKLAVNGGSILKAKRPRIVRAEYGMPPNPKTGEPKPTSDSAWKPVPLDTTAATYTSGTITISITPW